MKPRLFGTAVAAMLLAVFSVHASAVTWDKPQQVGTAREFRQFQVTMLDSGDALITWATRGGVSGGRVWAALRKPNGQVTRPRRVSGRRERVPWYVVGKTGPRSAVVGWGRVPRTGEAHRYRLSEWRKNRGFRALPDIPNSRLGTVAIGPSGEIATFSTAPNIGRPMAAIRRPGKGFESLELPSSWNGSLRGGDIAVGPDGRVMVVWINEPEPAVEAVVFEPDTNVPGPLQRVREPAPEETNFWTGPLGANASWSGARRFVSWGRSTNPCNLTCPGWGEFSFSDGNAFSTPTRVDAGGSRLALGFQPLPHGAAFAPWPNLTYEGDEEGSSSYLRVGRDGSVSHPRRVRGQFSATIGPQGRPYLLTERCARPDCARRVLRGFSLRSDGLAPDDVLARSVDGFGARLDSNQHGDMAAVFQRKRLMISAALAQPN